VLLELGVIKASTPLIVPGQEHFSIQARRSAASPHEKPGLSYLTSAVGPQDAQATTETVQVGRLAQSFGTSLPADEVQAGLCRDSVP
jgi:hypothetical protein